MKNAYNRPPKEVWQGIIGLLIICIIIYQYNQPKKNNPDTPTLQIVQTKEEPMLDSTVYMASDIDAYYHDNEVNADRRFKDNLIFVGGLVTSIQKDFLDKPYVTLQANNMFMPVHCYLSEDEASKLHKRHVVILKAKCKGMVMGSIMFEDGTIIGYK